MIEDPDVCVNPLDLTSGMIPKKIKLKILRRFFCRVLFYEYVEFVFADLKVNK